jgi:DNA-directed RNA polymerase subunit M
MEFWCDECGSLMYHLKKGGKSVLTCKRCGFTKEPDGEINDEAFTISTKIRHSEKDRIEIIKDNGLKAMPTTKEAQCPKCNNREIAYWQVQTRGADEGMTTFYRCIKCKFTWRAY